MSLLRRRRKLWVYRDAEGLWRWRLTAGNHRIVAASEQGYVRRSYALDKGRAAAGPNVVEVIET